MWSGIRMAKFSANLGFLWQELALPDAIRAAKRQALTQWNAIGHMRLKSKI